ncbi:sigma-70 family RNA polymerase sigma factor [Caldibacillus thermoamylovorans]
MENEEKVLKIDDDDFDINEFLVETKRYQIDQEYNENIELLKRFHSYLSDSDTLLEELIKKNIGLVRKAVNYYSRYINHKLDEDDLMIEGILGLIKAIQRFDPSLKGRLSTYAVWWIHQAIMRSIINDGFTIRVPVHMFEQIRKVTRKENESYKLFQKIDVAWVCQELGISKEKYYELKANDKRYLHMSSLHSFMEEDGDELIDFISNNVEHIYEFHDEKMEDPLELVYRSEVRDKIFAALDRLTEREKYVIINRFGLVDDQPKTLEEIGKELGVTRERTRQIEAKALNKLRKYLQRFFKEV